jgi:thiol-disulfide isomerase/thioredoxin
VWSLECNFTKFDFALASTYGKSIGFIEVDVTNDTDTITKYELFDYPSIIFFSGTSHYIHIGDSDPKSLISFAYKYQHPLISYIDSESQIINDCLSSVVIISDTNYKYTELAEKNIYFHFYIAKAPINIKENSYNLNTALIIRRGAVYSVPLQDEHSLQSTLIQIDIETSNYLNEYVGEHLLNDMRDMIIMFYAFDNPNSTQYLEVFDMAAKLRKDIVFAKSDRKTKIGDRFLAFLELNDCDLPKVIIIHPTEKRTYSYRLNSEITVGAIITCIENWKIGNLTYYLKSEQIPSSQENPYVMKIVSMNYDKEVTNFPYDVMVKYFSLGCTHCQNFKPIYEELAKKVTEAGNNIKFVEIDITRNELSGIEILSYPTVHFIKANNKQSPIAFKNIRNVDNLIEFLKEHATTPLKI